MTGIHETSSINTFTHGVGDRGSSIRISKQVHHEGKGFLEDRRPASNLDPYLVLSKIMRSVLTNEDEEELENEMRVQVEEKKEMIAKDN